MQEDTLHAHLLINRKRKTEKSVFVDTETFFVRYEVKYRSGHSIVFTGKYSLCYTSFLMKSDRVLEFMLEMFLLPGVV